MADILKFPGQAPKLGYSRVKRRARCLDDPDQLDLFPPPRAQILPFAREVRPFEQALKLDERGDPRAAAFYQRAIEEEDCVADAYCNLGIIESQQGRITKAFDCFTTSLKHEPRHPQAHFNLANLYFELNDFRLAQAHYEMAGEVDSSFANAHFNLALIYAINHNVTAAIEALLKYRELVPEEEASKSDDLLLQLRQSLVFSKNPQFG